MESIEVKQEIEANENETISEETSQKWNEQPFQSVSLPVIPSNQEATRPDVYGLGLTELDIQKLKDGELNEISEEGKERLEELDITEDMVADMLLNSMQEEIGFSNLDGLNEENNALNKVDDKKSEIITELKRESFTQFLHSKGFSTSFVKVLMECGVTDEAATFLKAMSISEDEVIALRELWRSECRGDSKSIASSSSSEDLSMHSLYLKHNLGAILAKALREIIQKKPCDPVEYLAHWLLNYKICEERRQRQREMEIELCIEREKLRKQKIVEDHLSVSTDHEEEHNPSDWNYVNYEGK